MPPTCDSVSRSRRETAPEPSAASISSAGGPHFQAPLCEELQTLAEVDAGPFYGMLDRDEEEEDELLSQWALQAIQCSPRRAAASLPGASETFRCAMRQLDGEGEDGQTGQYCSQHSISSASTPSRTSVSKETAVREGKSLKETETTCEGKARLQGSSKVQKSSSFSSRTSSRHAALSASSSPHTSVDDGCSACLAERRRLSVPCSKHVQWADEAGVSDLVSVRLIKPRLAKAAASDKDDSQVPVRSIFYRLSGLR